MDEVERRDGFNNKLPNKETKITTKKDNITKSKLQERVTELENDLQNRENFIIDTTFELNENKTMYEKQILDLKSTMRDSYTYREACYFEQNDWIT